MKHFEKAFTAADIYAVQAESLKSISKCGSKKQLALIKEAESLKSYRNIINEAAIEAGSMIMNK